MSNLKNKLSVILLICALIFLMVEIKFSLTGNVTSEYFGGKLFLIRIIGFVLLFISILMLTTNKSLDAVIIPTGDLYERNIRRAKKGVEKSAKYYLITGYIDKNKPVKESQIAEIYNELRKYGIKPSQMKIESESKDSLDNILYSLNKLKGLKRIGIVSYPEHLKRFEYIINKGKKEGIINKEIEFVEIPTEQNIKEKTYGILGNIKEKYRLRNGVEKAKYNKPSIIGRTIKKIME